MQCTKCKIEMHKKGVLTAGNTKYEKWQCTKCWTEQSRALGVIGGVPK
jgi:hypothetical protein